MTDDIRDKTRAVFLAAIMVLSMVAMSATFAGAAAASNHAEETSIDNLEITDGDTIGTGWVEDASNLDPEVDADRTGGTYDDVPISVAQSGSGLIGVPFDFAPFNQFDTDDQLQVDQSLDLDMTLAEGDSVETTIDVTEAYDAGLVIDDLEVTDPAEAENIETDVTDVGEIQLTFDATGETDTATFSFDVTWEADDLVAGLDIDGVTETLSHEASGDVILEDDPDESIGSDSDNYRVVDTGAIGIGSDAGDDDPYIGEDTDIPTAFDGTATEDAWDLWAGSTITVQDEAGENTVVEVFEANRVDGTWETGDREMIQGTNPGSTTSLDTSELDPNGEYFLVFDEDDTKDVYIDLRPLNLDTDVDEQITEDEDVEIDVSADDVGQTEFDAAVQAWFIEDGDAPSAANTIHVEEGQLDGDGSTTLSASPTDDLNGVGDYYAIVAHSESGNFVLSDTVEVIEPLDEDVQITSPRPGDEEYVRGDIVEVTADLENIQRATITLGDRASGQNFELNVTVRDDDGSGDVSFLINTFQLGDGPTTEDDTLGERQSGPNEGENVNHGVRTVDDGTSIVNVEAHPGKQIGGGTAATTNTTDPTVVIAASNYDLVASPGNTPHTETRSTDRSQVRLLERGEEAIETFSAPAVNDPADIEGFDFIDDIQNAVDEEIITPQEGDHADEDFLVVQIEADGLEGVLAETIENQSLNTDLAELLDRDGSHSVTEPFTATDVITLSTMQDLDQVAEIVGEALEDDQANVPVDTTHGLPAVIDLTADDDNQNVLADVDDSGNINEYFLLTPVNADTVQDVGDIDIDFFDSDTQDAIVAAHDNIADDDVIRNNPDDEIATNEIPTRFNTSFTLDASPDGEASGDYPLNELFDDATTIYQDWTLVDDVVALDRFDEDEEMLLIPPRDNFEVTGTTDVAAGTTLSHTTQTAAGETPPFFDAGEFTIDYVEDEDNEFAYEINEPLSEHAGQNFNTEIRRVAQAGLLTADGSAIQGMVTEPTEVREHVFEDQESGGQVVVVDAINLSVDGHVVISDEDGDELGSEELSEGLNEDVSVLLDENLEETQDLTSTVVDADGDEMDRVADDAVAGTEISQTATVTLIDDAEAFFQVSNLDPIAVTAEPGDELTVTADITNAGDADGEQDVELRLDGDAVATQDDFSVAADATEQVSFTVNAPDTEGTYTHSIASENDEAQGQLTVEVEEEEPEPEPDPDPDPEPEPDEDDDADDDGAGFGIAAALIALLGAALVAFRRRAN